MVEKLYGRQALIYAVAHSLSLSERFSTQLSMIHEKNHYCMLSSRILPPHEKNPELEIAQVSLFEKVVLG